jgi:hypothetical protein
MSLFTRTATISLSIILSLVTGNATLGQLTKLPSNQPAPSKTNHYNKDSFKQLQQVPSNFPVPLYSSNVISTNYQEATSLNGVHSIAAMIRTSDPPTRAFQWYQSAVPAQGFDVLKLPQPQGLPAGVEAYIIKARKPGEVLSISCCRLPKSPATVINVTVTAK